MQNRKIEISGDNSSSDTAAVEFLSAVQPEGCYLDGFVTVEENAQELMVAFAERVFFSRSQYSSDEKIINSFKTDVYPKISVTVNHQKIFNWLMEKEFNKYKNIADFFLSHTPVALTCNGLSAYPLVTLSDVDFKPPCLDPFAKFSPIYFVMQPEWIDYLVAKGADIDEAENHEYKPFVRSQVELHLLNRSNKVRETLSQFTNVSLLFTHHDSNSLPRVIIDSIISYMGNVNNPIVPKRSVTNKQEQMQASDDSILELFDPLYEPKKLKK